MPPNNPNRNSTPPTPPLPPKRASPACAACKHQRRRCSDQCLLLPYFPAHKAKEFRNVHRLFGISNIISLLERVPEGDREEAVKSLIYEANLRAINPVGGCAAVICYLQNEVNARANELNAVYRNLAILRAGKSLGITDRLGEDEFGGNSSRDESNTSLMDDSDQV